MPRLLLVRRRVREAPRLSANGRIETVNEPLGPGKVRPGDGEPVINPDGGVVIREAVSPHGLNRAARRAFSAKLRIANKRLRERKAA